MESKVCTYTEPNGERLQLLRVGDKDDFHFEIRANRVIIYRFDRDHALCARLVFYHCLHEILINRSHAMLNLT